MNLSLKHARRFIVFTSLVSAAFGEIATIRVGRDSGQLYQELCSGCHGEKLEGGKGPSLIANKWKHGGGDAALIHSIREGYPRAEMPAFKATVSDAEARALVAFIRETASRVKDPRVQASEEYPKTVQHTEDHSFRFESVAEGLDVPWSMAFLPDGRILVTERVGRLRVIENGVLSPQPIGGIPKVIVRDEAGLMSVVADPDYQKNGWIYLTFSDRGLTDEKAMTKLVRGRIRDGVWVDEQTIFSIPRENYQDGFVLFGSRMVFDGPFLYFSVGERGTFTDAQKLDVPTGKIHRILPDGTVPKDNPFVGQAGAVASIWAYGVRNPQGLARDPRTGNLWETEHGPRGGDELNLIRRGKNYGWPLVTFGMNYDGTPITDKTELPGMEPPVQHWTPSIATSEIEFYTGSRFPKWKGNLFLGSLAQQKFLRLVIDPHTNRVRHTEQIFNGIGRVRDIKTGPDGFIYVALELVGRPGRIVRLVPAS
jgi:glucose/arabinose dehydrogenase